MLQKRIALFLASASIVLSNGSVHNGLVPKKFTVNLSAGVPRMMDLVKETRLPSSSEFSGFGNSSGIALVALERLRTQWLDEFNWDHEEAGLNSYKHFTVEIEGLTIHYIHQRASDKNSIPLLLNHGWPGSFLEFLPIVDELTEKSKTSIGRAVSFHVVIPSLPGFTFSSPPPANWTVDDTARVFNTLMREVLGYDQFATFGTDWGCAPAYSLYDNFNISTRAAHFAMLPFQPPSSTGLAAQNITLSSPLQQFEEQRSMDWFTSGNAYFSEQTTRPNTIGLALLDNPIGQLAWIGEKFISWSDPKAGTSPSILNHNEILLSVSLYYLTRSFFSSVYIYYQNPNGFKTSYTKAHTDAPLLFSAFKYNIAFWPQPLVAKVGNLVMYNNHEFGGHFPGLDNPPALLHDLREIANYWV
ncbi:Alpha/Beta hydrolase protein [Trichoderma austrokoningii]